MSNPVSPKVGEQSALPATESIQIKPWHGIALLVGSVAILGGIFGTIGLAHIHHNFLSPSSWLAKTVTYLGNLAPHNLILWAFTAGGVVGICAVVGYGWTCFNDRTGQSSLDNGSGTQAENQNDNDRQLDDDGVLGQDPRFPDQKPKSKEINFVSQPIGEEEINASVKGLFNEMNEKNFETYGIDKTKFQDVVLKRYAIHSFEDSTSVFIRADDNPNEKGKVVLTCSAKISNAKLADGESMADKLSSYIHQTQGYQIA